jgi:hypothetical protein
MLDLLDVVELSQSSRRTTEEGFLEAQASFARPGIQPYSIDELNRDKLPERFQSAPVGTIIRMFRPPKEVFDKDAMKSFANTPLTLGHPPTGRIDRSNFKDLQVGFSGSNVVRKSGQVQGKILVQDEAAVALINQGIEQISAGYRVEIEDKEGTDPNFGPYDIVQRKIRVNHLAIVDRGRAGNSVRIHDHKKESSEMSLVKRTFEGITIELTDQGAQVLDKLEAKNQDLQTLLDSGNGEVTELRKKLSETEAALDVERKQQLSDEQIDKRVAERIALADEAKAIFAEVEVNSKSDQDIKAQVLTHVLGDSFSLEGKDENYVNGAFAALKVKAEETPGRGLQNLADRMKPNTDKKQDLKDWRAPVIAAHQAKLDAHKQGKE